MKIALFIDNNRVDMFADEEVVVNSSVLDIRNIDKNTTEFSNSFTLPATNTNNEIFKHYYNADIDNGFDAREAVDSRIEVHGDLFRSGKITLQKVSLKKGLAYSYTVNFFGQLLSLKKLIGTDKLSSLDTSEFNEDNTPAFIKALLTNQQTPYEVANSLARRYNLICNMMVKKRCYYASSTDTFDTETLSNLHYEAANDEKGVNWYDLIPSINVHYLLQLMEDKYSIKFSTNFISVAPFYNLYMLLDNSSTDKSTPIIYPKGYDVGATEKVWIKPDAIDIDVVSGYTYEVKITIYPSVIHRDLTYTLRVSNNYINIHEEKGKGVLTFTFLTSLVGSVYLTYSLEIDSYFTYIPHTSVQQSGDDTYYEAYTNINSYNLPVIYKVNKNLPDITIMDFLKGLLQAFKLVMIVGDNGDIYFDTIDAYYGSGNVVDITKYVDTSKTDISRGTVLNTVKFKFQEPTTILAKQFKGSDEDGYGDEVLYIYDDDGNLVDGTSKEIILPFEMMVYERLNNSTTAIQTTVSYGALIDNSLEPVSVKPHLHYTIQQDCSNNTIGFKPSGTTIEELDGNYNRPSHVKYTDSNGIPFLFGSEVDEYTYEVMTDNLYSKYYSTYISSLFNPKQRTYNFNTKGMPINIINSIGLNDIIIIRNNRYRINNFKSSLVSGNVTFNLFNIYNNE